MVVVWPNLFKFSSPQSTFYQLIMKVIKIKTSAIKIDGELILVKIQNSLW